MGMFGFLKKKPDEAVPDAPQVPGVTPPLDLPDIKLDGMDTPPAPDPNMALPEQPPGLAEPQVPEQPSLFENQESAMPDYNFESQMSKPEPAEPMPADPMQEVEPIQEPEPVQEPTQEPELEPIQEPEPVQEPTQEPELEPIQEPEGLQDPEPADQPQLYNEEIEPIQVDDAPQPEIDTEDTLPGMAETKEIPKIDPGEVADTFDTPDDIFSAEPAPPADEAQITPSRRVINHTLFINVEEFRSIAGIIAGLSDDAKGAEETLFRIKDVALGREKVFDKWQNDLELVERELIQLDKLLFNV